MVAIPKPDDVFRVVAVGGSTTFGHALDVNETWAAQLQRVLRDEYGIERAEVVNLGNPGYFSLDSVVNFATRGLAYEPDMVIVYHGVNDAVVRMYTDSACYLGDTPLHGFGMDRGVWQYDAGSLPTSTLYRVLAYNLGAFENPAEFTHRMEHTGFCPPEVQDISPVDNLANHPPTYFARNLRTIAGTAAAHDVDVMLSTFGWDVAAARASLEDDPELYHTAALLTAIDEQNALVREIAAETDAMLADFAAEVDENPAYWQGDQVHQTADGARAQAELYAALVADSLNQ
jgi:lysophospholipase L1-like esterase